MDVSFDLLNLYANKETTLAQIKSYTLPSEQPDTQHTHTQEIPTLSFLCSPSISPLSAYYDKFPTTMLPIHNMITSEIRSHTFILDNVYGKEGIHTKKTDIWIHSNQSWYTFDSMTSTLIQPNACVLEIEKHTYLSNKDSPLQFSISILVHGRSIKNTPTHPLVLLWEMVPLHNYSITCDSVQEEYERIKRALSTI